MFLVLFVLCIVMTTPTELHHLTDNWSATYYSWSVCLKHLQSHTRGLSKVSFGGGRQGAFAPPWKKVPKKILCMHCLCKVTHSSCLTWPCDIIVLLHVHTRAKLSVCDDYCSVTKILASFPGLVPRPKATNCLCTVPRQSPTRGSTITRRYSQVRQYVDLVSSIGILGIRVHDVDSQLLLTGEASLIA